MRGVFGSVNLDRGSLDTSYLCQKEKKKRREILSLNLHLTILLEAFSVPSVRT